MRPFFLFLLSALFLAGAPGDEARALEKVSFPASSRHEGKQIQLVGELFRPAGTGRFPAVVLMHGCAGWSPPTYKALTRHAEYLASQGFIALNLDSFGPRGNGGGRICKERAESHAASLYRALDAFDARAFLAARDDVDPRNIFQMGQSHGGGVSIRIADRKNVVFVPDPERNFRAAVGFYPWCGAGPRTVDLGLPLLVLVGDEDDWTPAKPCEAIKLSGAPYEFIMYRGAVHGFDLEMKERRYLGYRLAYDGPAARDSRIRMVDFLRRNLTPDRQGK